jgi:hypothetical protein
MYTLASKSPLDFDALRARMDDAALLRFGQAAAYMCSPGAQGKPPRETFVVQLREARAEWRRRRMHRRNPIAG